MLGFCNLGYAQKSNLISEQDSIYKENGLLHTFQNVDIKIQPSLPIYQLQMTTDELPKEDKGWLKKAVININVYRNDSKKLVQSITDTLRNRTAWVGISSYDQEFPDVNFDGFTDLPIKVISDMSGNHVYDFWLFDSDEKRFKYNENFTHLFKPYISTYDSTISTTSYVGCGRQCYANKTYKVSADSLILVKREEKTRELNSDGNSYYITTIKERKNGDMETIKIDSSKIEY